MKRRTAILLGLAGIGLAFVAESYWGWTTYRLNGVSYAVPHKYEFMRNYRIWWLEGIKGLEKEPDESIWLLLSAEELARDMPGYRRTFHGYVGNPEADLVVNILGGKEAREFPDDYKTMWEKAVTEERNGAPRKPDTGTPFDRVEWMGGTKGTPGENHSLFYLVPNAKSAMPLNWLPPSCQGSPDIDGRETYNCRYTIHEGGLTYQFSLRQENFGLASRMPDYIKHRLDSWRH